MANKMSNRRKRRDVDGLGQLIADECACWRGGGCLGVGMDHSFDLPLPRCLVLLGERCSYFEKCVLPITAKNRSYYGAWDQYQQRTAPDAESTLEELSEEDQAVYRWHPFVDQTTATASQPERLCECGEPLDTGKQLCPRCLFQRRKDRSGVAKEQKLAKAS